ncbi:uncharacterized protein LOC129579976 isoform X2 [Sitodiplosis mosellana]|uniref:uncharacterized protein LOC129579976 isoform X2 n=1 Tax=Sitodiplosis mosellana TaxID=263140 RepID=UPI0024444218|nr:uncharacterized protein LOC129579976 isoform X2 [Sitodiplosis mosellana]
MGIKGFEKYIISNVHKGFVEQINIRAEIRKWREEHGRDPTIIIDLKELNRVLGDRVNRHQTFEMALFNGGRYQKFNEILEYFFGEMKISGANLVFIARLDEGKYKDIKAFKSSSARPNERMLFNMLHSICSKFGEVHVSYGLKKCAIVAYVHQHRDNIMALITRDTNFLVFSDVYELWSLNEVDFRYLKIARFDRNRIYRDLNLNAQQMHLMLAINELQPSTKRKLVGDRDGKLPALVNYVRPLQLRRNGYDINLLTANAHLNEDERNELEVEIAHMLSVINYSDNFNEDIYEGLILDLVNNDESFNRLLQFFKENIYFAYKLMNETSTVQKDLLLIDICRPDAMPFIDLVINVTMRMGGVIFMDVEEDKQPKTRSVKFQRVRGEPAVQSEMEIIYPPMQMPSLIELIVEEDCKSVDWCRWYLLRWLLDVPKAPITKIETSQSSKYMRIATLTLDFLKHHGIIRGREANAILEVESSVQSATNPRTSRTPPPKPQWKWDDADASWVQIAHKYTITFELICHCLEVCGLRNETALIQFDAYELYARRA